MSAATPTPTTAMSQGRVSPVDSCTDLTMPRALADEARDHRAHAERDALGIVARGKQARDPRRNDPREQPVGGLDHRGVDVAKASRGRDLEPDEAAADNDQALALGKTPGDGKGLVDIAQTVDVAEVGAGHGEIPHARTGGEDEVVVVDGRAVVENDAFPGPVDRARRNAESEVDVTPGRVALRPDEAAVEFGDAEKDALR